MFRRVDADLKVHPLPEIFRIPAAFRIPAGIAFHSDLIPHRCLVVFLFICHIASDSILICGHRTIIVDPDRISAPGHLIQILSHHRFRDIFILGCVKPSHVSPCGSIVPHTLGLDLRDIPDKLFSENKLRIQGARSVRKRQYLKWHCRIFRSCSPDRIRSFFSRRQPDGGRLLHNSDRAVLPDSALSAAYFTTAALARSSISGLSATQANFVPASSFTYFTILALDVVDAISA